MKKKLKSYLKEEKGGIALFTFSVMLFTVAMLSISYIGMMNRLRAQEKQIETIQRQYTADNIDQEYQKAIKKIQ